jgi:hypothetical protein
MILPIQTWMDSLGVPRTRDTKTVQLYSDLIREELAELENEIDNGPSAEELKEGVDLIWVVVAKLLSLGYDILDIYNAMAEVYSSNMTKLSTNREALEALIKPDQEIKQVSPTHFVVVDKNGKIQKGPFYRKADIKLKYTRHV